MGTNIIKIGQYEINKTFSLLREKAIDCNKIVVNDRLPLWLYENVSKPFSSKITIKQIKFLSNLVIFALNYQRSNKFNSKQYIPSDVAEFLIEKKLIKKTNFSVSSFLKEVLSLFTLDFSDFFTLSFFSLLNISKTPNEKNIKDYIENYREINNANLKIFNILMRNEIVLITRNIFGDPLIFPILPNNKTLRNTKAIIGNSFLIMKGKINIVDLSCLYLVSSDLKIEDNLIVGKFSRKKIQKYSDTILLNEVQNVIKRISPLNRINI